MYISKRMVIAGVLLTLLLSGAAYVFAQDEGMIDACVNPAGSIRILKEGESCLPKESLLSWNKQGPQGPEGPQGPPGVLGFYYAPQVKTDIPPGKFDDVLSHCDLGDFAVAGSIVIYADNFNIMSSGPVIDGPTGRYSWALVGVNEGSDDAEIRVSAVCADLTE